SRSSPVSLSTSIPAPATAAIPTPTWLTTTGGPSPILGRSPTVSVCDHRWWPGDGTWQGVGAVITWVLLHGAAGDWDEYALWLLAPAVIATVLWGRVVATSPKISCRQDASPEARSPQPCIRPLRVALGHVLA